jgi:hypothetical protein
VVELKPGGHAILYDAVSLGMTFLCNTWLVCMVCITPSAYMSGRLWVRAVHAELSQEPRRHAFYNHTANCNTHMQEGKLITKCKVKAPLLESGAVLELHTFVAEYDREIPIEEFK